MRRLLYLTLTSLSCLPLLSNCATEAGNARLENRLDRREDRMDDRLDRMSIRGKARDSRWQRMKQWENERYEERWDALMH